MNGTVQNFNSRATIARPIYQTKTGSMVFKFLYRTMGSGDRLFLFEEIS